MKSLVVFAPIVFLASLGIAQTTFNSGSIDRTYTPDITAPDINNAQGDPGLEPVTSGAIDTNVSPNMRRDRYGRSDRNSVYYRSRVKTGDDGLGEYDFSENVLYSEKQSDGSAIRSQP